ncbi:hypothetical protein IAD21_01869 [Abditibacteriota bacterium]|nr:hypothetical protein IAD21_01869 [Abditibacteriota bacterium]
MARFPIADQDECVWDNRNRLWAPHGNGWDVWQAPWRTSTRVEAHIPRQVWNDTGKSLEAFEPNFQTVACFSSGSPISIQLWRKGKHLFDANIALGASESGERLESVEWSPEGQQLAFSLGGWVGYEQEGAHELWVLDVASQKLRLVARGAVEGWVMVDRATQDTDPAWSRDGKTLFWGSQGFGINATNVQSATERRIFGPPGVGATLRRRLLDGLWHSPEIALSLLVPLMGVGGDVVRNWASKENGCGTRRVMKYCFWLLMPMAPIPCGCGTYHKRMSGLD